MKNKLCLIVATTVLLLGCKNTENNNPPQENNVTSSASKLDSSDQYTAIRKLVWNSNPDSLGLKINTDSVYCIILDMGLGDESVASLIVIADGTTSIYINTGGGIFGAGQHEQVREASDKLLKIMPHPTKRFSKTDNYQNIPNDSRARFYLLTRNGKYVSDEFNADDAADGKGYYSKLFIQANHIITAARESSKK